MNPRIAALLSLATLFVCTLSHPSYAQVDPRPIEAARAKTVLEPGDLQAIDEFVAGAVREIVRTRDFSQVGKARAALASKRGMQAQYVQQFSDSCKKYIAAGFQQATSTGLPEDRRFRATLNLLILVYELQDPTLAELALPYLGSPNKALQYEAVQIVTSTTVVERIKQGNWPLGTQILSQVQQAIRGGSPATWGLIAEFGAKLGTVDGISLLTEVADLRIAQYTSGRVQDSPQLDTTILKLLGTRIAAENGKTPAVIRRFAQLYSYVIQYLAKAFPILSDTQRQTWVSVVVEVEEKGIAPMLDGYPMSLRKAIEKADTTALMAEHDALLGGPASPGRLAAKWPFDYGAGPDGKVRTSPLELPPAAK